MPSFGENLKREREKRNITLDQISQSTKISTRMLHALEDDKFSQLPGGIFNKGFVRAYARCVGLDEDQTVADYLEASGDRPPVQPEIPVEEPVHQLEARPESPQRPLPWGMFAALLLLAALALSLWSHRQKSRDVAATEPSARPAATQPVAESSAPSGPASGAAVEIPASRATVPSTAAPPEQITPASAVRTTTGRATPQTDASAVPREGGFEVVVLAREDSWTTIIADGRRAYSGTLVAGAQRAIRARKQIVVRTGNAGAIDLFFNGTKLPPQGNQGDVRIITFRPEGLTPDATPPPPTP